MAMGNDEKSAKSEKPERPPGAPPEPKTETRTVRLELNSEGRGSLEVHRHGQGDDEQSSAEEPAAGADD